MKELIYKLAGAVAPAGSERDLQEQLLDYVKQAADHSFIDAMGNAIASKQGAGPHIALIAHADEVGLMVIHFEKEGYLRVLSLGTIEPTHFVGRHVHFTNGVIGVVGVSPHVKLEDLSIEDLFVDIGASSDTEARQKVHIGLSGVVKEEVIEIEEHRIAGRALDNRVGCAIAISVFNQLAEEGQRVSVVFTAQQTVGSRGAGTAAYQLEPDLAFVIDAAPAGDTPDAERMALKLGKGPAIKIMDRNVIVQVDVKDSLIEAAKKAGIEVQYEVWKGGATDAGAIERTRSGIPVGGVSYPARYVGAPSTLIDLRDAEGAVHLLLAAIKARR